MRCNLSRSFDITNGSRLNMDEISLAFDAGITFVRHHRGRAALKGRVRAQS